MLLPKRVYDEGVQFADEVLASVRDIIEDKRSRVNAKRAKTEPPLADMEAHFVTLTDAICSSSIGSIPYPTTAEETESLLKQVDEFQTKLHKLGKEYRDYGFGYKYTYYNSLDAHNHYSVLRDHLAGKQRTIAMPAVSVRHSHFPLHQVVDSRTWVHGLTKVRDAECVQLHKDDSSTRRPALYQVRGREGMFYLAMEHDRSSVFLCREPGTIYSSKGGNIVFEALHDVEYEKWENPELSSCRDTFSVTIPKNGSIAITKDTVETFGYIVRDAILIQSTSE